MLQQPYTMLYTLPTQPDDWVIDCILISPLSYLKRYKYLKRHDIAIAEILLQLLLSTNQSIFSAYYLVCYTVANKLKFFTWNIRNFDIILYHITIISIRSSLLQSQTYLKLCWFWSCDFLFSITDKTNNTNNTVGVLYEAETAYFSRQPGFTLFLVGSVLLIWLVFCVVFLVGSVLFICLVFCVVFLVGSVLFICLVFCVV